MLNLKHPLVPKHPRSPVRVIAIGRISTPQQNVESITASHRYAEDFIRRSYSGPMETIYLGEQASGMRAERRTIKKALELIRSGEWDLVIAEDLSRIYRN